MSCIFCHSVFHLLEYCDIFVSDDQRKEYLQSKNYCVYCLKKNIGLPCGKNYTAKCYICFSTSHPTVLCPTRSTAQKLFIPNIDHDLLPRFIEMSGYHPLEQLILSFYLPKNVHLLHLKPIKVEYVESFCNTSYGYKEPKIIVAKKVYHSYIHSIELSQWLNNLYFIAESVLLYGSKIPAWKLLKFLSSSTKVFKCINVEVTTKLSFAQILEQLPYVEEIYFNNTNIEIGNLWVEELMKFVVERNFKKLSLKLDEKSCDFNVKALAEFMKTKSAEGVNIRLQLTEKDVTHFFKDNLLIYFVPFHLVPGRFPLLFLQISDGMVSKNECFTLKNI